jgi:hypothetical protein
VGLLGGDRRAAAPLTVIATIAILAAAVTAIVLMATLGGGRSALRLQQVTADGNPAFQVTETHGGLSWDGLSVAFLDPAGVDQASLYLDLPNGSVETGDQIQVRVPPAAGTYVLVVSDGARELARVAAALP